MENIRLAIRGSILDRGELSIDSVLTRSLVTLEVERCYRSVNNCIISSCY